MPSNTATRETALNALVQAINKQRPQINEDFEIQDWVVVI
jgi:hypothetical protein